MDLPGELFISVMKVPDTTNRGGCPCLRRFLYPGWLREIGSLTGNVSVMLAVAIPLL
jgi:hypothetical protein